MAIICLSLCSCAHSPTDPKAPSTPAVDLAAARAVFEKNIQAIQDKDQAAYLSCYRNNDNLVRAGGSGITLGYTSLAQDTAPSGSEEWPERLDAQDIQVFWLQPGLVYGSYRYEVVINGKTTRGVSERLFLKTVAGWKIAVSTAFEIPTP